MRRVNNHMARRILALLGIVAVLAGTIYLLWIKSALKSPGQIGEKLNNCFKGDHVYPNELETIYPNRELSDHHGFVYRSWGNSFLIRSTGDNHMNEFGMGDDIDVYGIDGQFVSRDRIIKFLESSRYSHDLYLLNGEVMEKENTNKNSGSSSIFK